MIFSPILVLEITALFGVVVVLGTLAWIGWTMATTHAPEPLADVAPPATTSKQMGERSETSPPA